MKEKKYLKVRWKAAEQRATEKYSEQIIEEIEELEENKSEEALLLVQKRHDLWRYQNERDEAKRLQSSGNSGLVLQHPFSSESCRSSTVDHDEEMTLVESIRKRQEVHEVMKETEWKEARGREEEAWRLEPEGETKMPETGVEVKNDRSQSDVPGEGEEI